MKNVATIYSGPTKAAFEDFNSKLAEVDTERKAIAQEKADILADAIAGRETAAKLRKRIDATRDRTLQADLVELSVLGALPELEKAARADWQTETARCRKLEAERLAKLEQTADELGTEGAPRHRMILEDKIRRSHEEGAKAAQAFSSKPLVVNPDDTARVEALRSAILGALK